MPFTSTFFFVSDVWIRSGRLKVNAKTGRLAARREKGQFIRVSRDLSWIGDLRLLESEILTTSNKRAPFFWIRESGISVLCVECKAIVPLETEARDSWCKNCGAFTDPEREAENEELRYLSDDDVDDEELTVYERAG